MPQAIRGTHGPTRTHTASYRPEWVSKHALAAAEAPTSPIMQPSPIGLPHCTGGVHGGEPSGGGMCRYLPSPQKQSARSS